MKKIVAVMVAVGLCAVGFMGCEKKAGAPVDQKPVVGAKAPIATPPVPPPPPPPAPKPEGAAPVAPTGAAPVTPPAGAPVPPPAAH